MKTVDLISISRSNRFLVVISIKGKSWYTIPFQTQAFLTFDLDALNNAELVIADSLEEARDYAQASYPHFQETSCGLLS